MLTRLFRSSFVLPARAFSEEVYTKRSLLKSTKDLYAARVEVTKEKFAAVTKVEKLNAGYLPNDRESSLEKAKFERLKKEILNQHKKGYERDVLRINTHFTKEAESFELKKEKEKADFLAYKEKKAEIPKRATSAFLFFVKEKYASLKSKDSNEVKGDKNVVEFGARAKAFAKEFSALSEEQKKPFVELAEKDSQRYRSEREAYVAKHTKAKVPSTNKYILYVKANMSKVRQENPTLTNTEIVKKIAENYRAQKSE